MDEDHGKTAPQNPHSLPNLPRPHPRRPTNRENHAIVTGGPAAGKLARWVRRGAVGKRSSTKPPPRPMAYPAQLDWIQSQIQQARQRGDRDTVRQLRRQLRQLPKGDPGDPGYRRLRYSRYADDHILGFAGPKA